MTRALKITVLRMALCGEFRPIMFRAERGPLAMPSATKRPANMAGMMAKYLATSLAKEKVVNVMTLNAALDTLFPMSGM